jgi:hypothetical protein
MIPFLFFGEKNTKTKVKLLISIHTKVVLEDGFLEVNLKERIKLSATSSAVRVIKLGCRPTQRRNTNRPAKAASNIISQRIFG